jgi:hypothetical protein
LLIFTWIFSSFFSLLAALLVAKEATQSLVRLAEGFTSSVVDQVTGTISDTVDSLANLVNRVQGPSASAEKAAVLAF